MSHLPWEEFKLTSPLCCANSSLQWDQEKLWFYWLSFFLLFGWESGFIAIFYIFLKNFSIFGCLALHCCTCALSSCGAQASHCDGFSCCRGAQQWALGHVGFTSCSTQAQELWHTGLVAPQHVGPSQTRDGTHVPCNDMLILHQWTTREVQSGHYWSARFLTRKLPPCIESSYWEPQLAYWLIGNHSIQNKNQLESLFSCCI